MLIDLGKIIGGPDEGDGMVGWLLGLFGGAAMLAGAAEGEGAAMAGKAAGRAAVGGEALGAIFRHGMTALDLGVDVLIWRDLLQSGPWRNMGKAAQETAITHQDIITGHSFLLQQLKAHSGANPRITELLGEYEKLGVELPSKNLLDSACRQLAHMLHPDHGFQPDDTLFKQLDTTRKALGNEQARASYEAALRRDRSVFEKIFEELGNANWQKAYEQARSANRANQKLLTGEGSVKSINSLRKWWDELGHNQRTGVVFGTVMAVGLGVYVTAAIADRWRAATKKQPRWTEKTKENTDTATQEPRSSYGVSA